MVTPAQRAAEYEAGQKAYWDGKPRHTNPHQMDDDDDLFLSWVDGWDDAENCDNVLEGDEE